MNVVHVVTNLDVDVVDLLDTNVVLLELAPPLLRRVGDEEQLFVVAAHLKSVAAVLLGVLDERRRERVVAVEEDDGAIVKVDDPLVLGAARRNFRVLSKRRARRQLGWER